MPEGSPRNVTETYHLGRKQEAAWIPDDLLPADEGFTVTYSSAQDPEQAEKAFGQLVECVAQDIAMSLGVDTCTVRDVLVISRVDGE